MKNVTLVLSDGTKFHGKSFGYDAPVAGEVIELNEALEENPELVNKDPYGEGWLIKVKPEDIKAVEDLLDAEAYKAVVNG